jgi:hypothetical protein
MLRAITLLDSISIIIDICYHCYTLALRFLALYSLILTCTHHESCLIFTHCIGAVIRYFVPVGVMPISTADSL